MTSFPDSHRDLLEAQVATFATVGGGGLPSYAFARKLGAKYGADLSIHDKPGETRVVVTIEPANVYAVDMSGG